MFSGTACGELLPVYVVYKAKNMWNTQLLGGTCSIHLAELAKIVSDASFYY